MNSQRVGKGGVSTGGSVRLAHVSNTNIFGTYLLPSASKAPFKPLRTARTAYPASPAKVERVDWQEPFSDSPFVRCDSQKLAKEPEHEKEKYNNQDWAAQTRSPAKVLALGALAGGPRKVPQGPPWASGDAPRTPAPNTKQSNKPRNQQVLIKLWRR
jgi:hypothetical protein